MRPPPVRLLASICRLVSGGVALVRNRLELLRVEAAEEAARVIGLLLWGFAAVLLGVVGAAFLAVFLTVLWWESHRLLALGIFSALFIAAAAFAVSAVRGLVRQGSRLFSASLAELQEDERTFSSGKRSP